MLFQYVYHIYLWKNPLSHHKARNNKKVKDRRKGKKKVLTN